MASHISHGADVEQLDDIAIRLRRQSERIADVGERGASLFERLRAQWDGPDFDKFAQSWRTAHRALGDTEASMRTFSRQLVDESDAQRQKSGVPRGQDHAAGAVRPHAGGSDHGVGGRAFERTDRLPGGPVVAHSLMAVLPDLSGADTIHPDDTGRLAFERLDQPPAQEVDPTSGHGASTPPGEPSVAFNPLIETMRGHLRRNDLHVRPWEH